MKLIIAGGRDYEFSQEDYDRLTIAFSDVVDEVVSGCANGADACGEIWARSHNIPVKHFPADWKKYGKSAGYRRNVDMAKYADAAVLFPGGRGTEHMYNIAMERGLVVFNWRDKDNA